MKVSNEQLKNFLLDSGLVSKEDLEKAYNQAIKTGENLGKVLLAEGKISEENLNRSYAYILGLPFIDLTHTKIDKDALKIIPEQIARRHNIVAYNQTKKTLEVAMLDISDFQAIDFLSKKTGLKILPRLTDSKSIKYALSLYQDSLKDELGSVIKKASEHLANLDLDDANPDALQKAADAVPAQKVVDAIIKHAILQGASDIHIEPHEDALIVRYRIDGILHDVMLLPKAAAIPIVARIKVLSKMRLDEKRLPQDGRFKVDTGAERVSFRVSTLPTFYGEKVVMRLLRENVSGFTLEKLGFHGKALERLHGATRKKTGLILVTGPTGSGKSTTLYTILDILNTPEVNISTIEDPIEYQMPRINQTQVKPEIGFTFATGLRTLVRQDPDIIMVGEIRDGETASLAVNAALTGHLVLSTLHTNSAAGAVARMIDLGVEPFLLASVLRVVVGQRLVRVLCPEKEKYTLSPKELSALKKIVELDRVISALKEEKIISPRTTEKNLPFYKPVSSPKCPEGYKGRIGIQEVLEVSDPIKDMILQNKPTDDIEKQAKKEGMLTMLEDGVFKTVAGTTSMEEVLRVVSE